MAVETFFHARPGSSLLRGITDDDFITWFDKTELASLKTNANIDNICECGRICSRDYEFRKLSVGNGNTNHDKVKLTSVIRNETVKIDLTTTDFFAASVESSIKEAENKTLTNITTTTTQTVTMITENIIETTTAPQNMITTTDSVQINNTVLISNQSQNTNDPIIVPTMTYMNNTVSVEMSNNIVPILSKISGELIVQKTIVSKPIKIEDIKKKPLIRRKGTLKATYGDRHEKFFMKIKNITAPNPHNIENIDHKMTQNKSNVIIIKKIEPLIESNVNLVNNISGNQISTDKMQMSNITQKEIILTTHAPRAALLETSTTAHVITAITKNNIKSMHYRTKKPKAMSQIKKPVIPIKQIETYNLNKTDVRINIDENKTKIKPIVSAKYTVKTLKSINKEIHKIPPTPISETSKSLSPAPKTDIAPENREGFEILDKNNLWELLKEDPDVDLLKREDKVQGSLSFIVKSVSNLTENDNRSL